MEIGSPPPPPPPPPPPLDVDGVEDVGGAVDVPVDAVPVPVPAVDDVDVPELAVDVPVEVEVAGAFFFSGTRSLGSEPPPATPLATFARAHLDDLGGLRLGCLGGLRGLLLAAAGLRDAERDGERRDDGREDDQELFRLHAGSTFPRPPGAVNRRPG